MDSNFADVTALLNEEGIQFTVENGGKHIKIRYVVNGVEHVKPVPKYSGNWRDSLNNVLEVRRVIRAAQPPPPKLAACPDCDRMRRKHKNPTIFCSPECEGG